MRRGRSLSGNGRLPAVGGAGVTVGASLAGSVSTPSVTGQCGSVANWFGSRRSALSPTTSHGSVSHLASSAQHSFDTQMHSCSVTPALHSKGTTKMLPTITITDAARDIMAASILVCGSERQALLVIVNNSLAVVQRNRPAVPNHDVAGQFPPHHRCCRRRSNQVKLRPAARIGARSRKRSRDSRFVFPGGSPSIVAGPARDPL